MVLGASSLQPQHHPNQWGSLCPEHFRGELHESFVKSHPKKGATQRKSTHSAPSLKPAATLDLGHATSTLVRLKTIRSDDCMDDVPPIQLRQPLRVLDQNM